MCGSSISVQLHFSSNHICFSDAQIFVLEDALHSLLMKLESNFKLNYFAIQCIQSGIGKLKFGSYRFVHLTFYQYTLNCLIKST